MASSNYMGGPDAMSFAYDGTDSGFSHPNPYGFGQGQQMAYPQQVFSSAAYTTSFSDGAGGAQQALYNPPPSTSYAVQPPAYNEYYLPASPDATTSITSQLSSMALGDSDGRGVIYTEQRGVHIRDISRRASEDQIRKMIREVTGSEAALIDNIKVPVLQDGAPRGHAFVHFRSASLARRLVDYLNGRPFQGRKLQVRLMKEGDAITSGAVSTSTIVGGAHMSSSSGPSSKHRPSGKHHHHHHQSGSGGGERKRTERRSEQSSSASASSSSKIKASSGKASQPILGNPVTASKEKHGKKASSVVIADGSSAGCM